jgi:hypothetical protein
MVVSFGFHGRIERLLAAGELVVDAAIGAQRVAFNGVEAVLLGKVGDVRDDVPAAHVSGQVHVRHRAQRT